MLTCLVCAYGTQEMPEVEKFKERFEEAMEDDFNMPLALSSLFDLVNFTNKNIDDIKIALGSKKTLLELSEIFGLNLKEEGKDLPAKVEVMIDERNEARKKKDYKRSDEIRKALADMGVILEDTKEGTVWRKHI